MNQYSFVWLGLSLLALTSWTIWRYYGMKYSILAALFIFVTLCFVQLVLSTKTNDVDTIVAFDNALDGDQPTFVMMYSDY